LTTAQSARRVGFHAALVSDFRQPATLIRAAQNAEAAGFDGIALSDHPYGEWQPDTWTVLSYLAAVTNRVTLSPNVIHLPARNPVVLAKAAATLDVLSSGRVALGLGAGDRKYHTGMRSMGLPTAGAADSLAALREAVAVIRLVWRGESPVTFAGTRYTLDEFIGGLRPAHRIDVLLGAVGPKALALAGEVADGWTVSRVSIDELIEKRRILDAAAARVGRNTAAISTRYNLLGRITNGPTQGRFDGPPDHWVEVLSELAIDGGVDTFLIHFVTEPVGSTEFQHLTRHDDTASQYRLFAEDVIPAVRDAVQANETRKGTIT